jgi:hypothetical protein
VSPFSAPVLLGAAVISAPSLWGAFVVGSTSTQTALVRFIACAGLAWLALAVLAMLVGPAPRPERVVTEPAGQPEQQPEPAESGSAPV